LPLQIEERNLESKISSRENEIAGLQIELQYKTVEREAQEKRLEDPETGAKEELHRDFVRFVNQLTSGPESQEGKRFGVRINHTPTYSVKREKRIWKDGLLTVELVDTKVQKVRHNQEAVEEFREYLRKYPSLKDLEGMSFDDMAGKLKKFLDKAPSLERFCEPYEAEVWPEGEEPKQVVSPEPNLFKK